MVTVACMVDTRGGYARGGMKGLGRPGEVSMSNRAVPGYVLEEMARRSVTNLLIVKPLNAYPGTLVLSSWRSAMYQGTNIKKSQRLPSEI